MKVIFITGNHTRHIYLVKKFSKFFQDFRWIVEIREININHQINDLKEITGYDAVSLQPNSGAQGEYAGLMTIRKFHKNNNQENRNVCLIPDSAHGTNPASAQMCGMKVVVVKCDDDGNVDIQDLKNKAEKYLSLIHI